MALRRTVCALVSGVLGLLVLTLAPGPAHSAQQQVCRLHDERIDEASGIARGLRSPQVFYVQNDSGDTHRFFALDARTCATRAVVTVPGADSVDWEDLAVAPDAQGTPSVWVADIGDNDAQRKAVTVYRVDEPSIGSSDTVRTARPDVWRLRYPNGPVDAESLAVSPRGVAYIVTKSLIGDSTVYRLPARPDAGRTQELVAVGRIGFAPRSITSLSAAARQVAATSAAISPDGSRFVVRTYTDAYLWTVRDGDVAAALRAAPTRIALPDQPQGEGIAFDGDRLLIDSEQRGSAVLTVALPARAAPTATGVAASSSAPPSSASAPASSPSPATSSSGARPAKGGNGSWVPGLIVLSAVVLGAAGWWTLQLRGRAGR